MTKGKGRPRLIEVIGKRDDWVCNGCGEKVPRWDDASGGSGPYATLDHRDPNGPSTPDNLWLMCNSCNSSKGRKSVDDWERTLDFDSTYMRKGFTMVPNNLLENASLSMGARMVLISLMSFAWRGDPFPGQERLAMMLGCGERTIRTHISELKEAGFLKIHRRGRGLTNVYRLSTGALMRQAESAGLDRQDPPVLREEDEVQEDSEVTSKAVTSRAPGESYDPLKGTKINGRNLPWDALVEETLADERVEAGRVAAALKRIRSALAGSWTEHDHAEGFEHYIAAEIRVRAALYRERWPDVELTPTALAANWSRVTTPRPGLSLDAALEAAQRGIDSARRTA